MTVRRQGETLPGGHDAYVYPVGGGRDGYRAACHDCGFEGECVHAKKDDARPEVEAHRLDSLEREPFRWCVYCGADREDAEEEHKGDCPMVTGLYPVRPNDLGPECLHCGERALGMRCMDCQTEFKVGDFYCRRPLPTPDSGEDWSEIVCPGCAVLVQEGSWDLPAPGSGER